MYTTTVTEFPNMAVNDKTELNMAVVMFVKFKKAEEAKLTSRLKELHAGSKFKFAIMPDFFIYGCTVKGKGGQTKQKQIRKFDWK